MKQIVIKLPKPANEPITLSSIDFNDIRPVGGLLNRYLRDKREKVVLVNEVAEPEQTGWIFRYASGQSGVSGWYSTKKLAIASMLQYGDVYQFENYQEQAEWLCKK